MILEGFPMEHLNEIAAAFRQASIPSSQARRAISVTVLNAWFDTIVCI